MHVHIWMQKFECICNRPTPTQRDKLRDEMIEKQHIIRELGELNLLLPSAINAALIANERVKYLFTLLQTARSHADQPGMQSSNLRREREQAGVENHLLDTVVESSRKLEDGNYHIPLLKELLSMIRECMVQMIVPFGITSDPSLSDIQGRFERLMLGLSGEEEVISGEAIDRLTSGEESAGDSLHLLVMDLHRSLNELQIMLASESVDGAMAYLLTSEDRKRLRSFMSGLNRTAPLKFGHPGLGTTATRTGLKLLIQNDIGLTDAHVIVITIEDLTANVTYTDIHIQRIQFFQSLFDGFSVEWGDTLSRAPEKKMEKQMYHLLVGRYRARDSIDLDRFLDHLGSRIVFLIDWNRARKRLRNFVPNSDAIGLLKWAAEQDIGHIAFLELGGDRLIFEALELASRIPLRYGEPLHQILGRERTIGYLQFVMQTATRGLLSKTSSLLLKDEIRAELLQYFRSAQEGIMELCEEHVSYSIEIGTTLLESLNGIRNGRTQSYIVSNAQRAKKWERDADDLVNRIRSMAKRMNDLAYYADLISVSDDVADYLEEASFFTTLIHREANMITIYNELLEMSDLALKGCKGYMRALIAAQDYTRNGHREDLQEFLKAVDDVFQIERTADEALRKAEKVIYENSNNFKEFRISLEIAMNIEESTNSLMKAVLMIRDRVLESVNR